MVRLAKRSDDRKAWGPSSETQVFTAPSSGGKTPKAIYTAAGGEPIVKGDGLTKLYLGDRVGGTTWSLNFSGSDLTQLAGVAYEGGSSTAHSFVMAFDRGTIYAADQGQASNSLPPQVLAIPATGGPITTLASGAPMVCPSGIAVGNGMIFIVDQCPVTIWELSKATARALSHRVGANY